MEILQKCPCVTYVSLALATPLRYFTQQHKAIINTTSTNKTTAEQAASERDTEVMRVHIIWICI